MNVSRCLYAPVYRVISSERTTEDGTPYTAYGISCTRKDVLGGNFVRTIEDISSDPELVGSMVNLFNMSCLSVDCFQRAVEDLIS